MSTKITQAPEILDLFAAQTDARTNIPLNPPGSGGASLKKGFPIETSLPLEQGGIPPKREDFNGILALLSEFAYYAQSGGMFQWTEKRDYIPGSLIVDNDKFYHCIKENGKNYGKIRKPANSYDYWKCMHDAATADKLKTPRKINGVAFDGTKDITIKAEANGGNADTADKLQTPCKINGVAFDGTRDITLGSGLSLSSDSYIDLSNDSITPYAGLIVMSTYGSGDVRLLFNGIEVGLTREGSETLGLYAGEKTRITFVSWGAIRVLSLRLYKIY